MSFELFIKTLIGCESIEVHDFITEKDRYHETQTVFVAKVALPKEEQYLCPICGQKCGKYDRANHTKRWRSLDLGNKKFFVECQIPRCICPEHGVLSQKIPWAIRDSDYTLAFETRVAYEAAKTPTNHVSKMYRIKWATVGNCVRRVQSYLQGTTSKYDNLKKIAIDETSYQKGHKYIITVQNLDTGEIVWAWDGFGDDVLKLLFESLTPEQLDGIEYVVADGARWITRQVEKFCPKAVRCVDPFHVVGWANDTLDSVRKRLSADTKKNASHC
jgi:transposase